MLETSAKYSGFAATRKDIAATEEDVTAAKKDVIAAEKEKENVKRMESDCTGAKGNRFYG